LRPNITTAELQELEDVLTALSLALWHIYDPGLKQFLKKYDTEES
jgi:hypothetical protein